MPSLRRPILRDQDSSATQGRIDTRPQKYPYTIHGRQVAYEGDLVWCPACKSSGAIKCIPPKRPMTGADGRQTALDGDLCMCKCPSPPRLIASYKDAYVGFEAQDIPALPGAAIWMAYAGHGTFADQAIEDLEIYFEVVDAKTDEPVPGLFHTLLSNGEALVDGQPLSGKTKAVSIHAYPDLEFVAWNGGPTR